MGAIYCNENFVTFGTDIVKCEYANKSKNVKILSDKTFDIEKKYDYDSLKLLAIYGNLCNSFEMHLKDDFPLTFICKTNNTSIMFFITPVIS